MNIAKKKKWIIIGGAAAAVAAALALIAVFIIVPGVQYNAAMALYEEDNYEQAGQAFARLGGYQDAAKYANKCAYKTAKAQFEDGEYASALEAFTGLGDYKDSEAYKTQCENEIGYAQGAALFEANDFEQALPVFERLGDFKDAPELLKTCENEVQYSKAAALLQQQDYEQAARMFEALGAFRDSVKQLEACANGMLYQDAKSALEMKNYALAADMFGQLGNYEDSATLSETLLPLEELHSYGAYIIKGDGNLGSNQTSVLKEYIADEEKKGYVEDIYNLYLYDVSLDNFTIGIISYIREYLDLLPDDYRHTAQLRDMVDAFGDRDYKAFAGMVESYTAQAHPDLRPAALRDVLMKTPGVQDKASLDDCLAAYAASRPLVGMAGRTIPREAASYMYSHGYNFKGDLDTLAGLCGAAADGKVLVVYRQNKEDADHVICTYFMDQLPDERVPKSADEVEFILTVEYEESILGFYGDTITMGIQEIARVKLVKCPSGKTSKTIGTVKGDKPPDSIVDDGSFQLSISGGSPDMDEFKALFEGAVEQYMQTENFEDYEYIVFDGGATINKYNGDSKTPVVPNTIDGMPVTRIRNGAFDGHEDITQITLPSGLRSVAPGVFQGFAALKEISLPDSVVYIGRYAFNECTSLTAIDLGEGVREIHAGAFEGCTGLKEITIPDSTYYIDEQAFESCSRLEKCTLPGGIRRIPKACFNGCTSLAQIDLPDVLEVIEAGAFQNSGLTAVSLPESLVYIGAEAFAQTLISALQFPASLKYIDENAFAGCPDFKEIHLPETILWMSPENFLDAWMTIHVKAHSCAHSSLLEDIDTQREAKIVTE